MRPRVLVAAAVVVGLVAGVAAVTLTASGGTDADIAADRAVVAAGASRPGPPPSADNRPGGTDVPAGAADVAGARAAAVAAVASTGEVVGAGFISRRDLIAAFTTEGFGPVLADVTSDQILGLQTEIGARDADPRQLAVAEVPLTATAVPTPAGVEVEVWSVLVVAAPGVGPGRAVWRTVTLTMVPVAGRGWLVDGWASTPGPTPALAPEIDVATAAELTVPLSWPAAEGVG